ncbi:MAG: DUF6607 family protein, partial [Gammaproteobacteria bacterium]
SSATASDGSYHVANARRSGSMRAKFTGDAMKLAFPTDAQGGVADVYVDGMKRGTVSFFSSAAGSGSAAFDDLGPGEKSRLAADVSKAAWSQTVYQVDESPRYSSVGRWEHDGTFSAWLSGETWRPLPRREWSVRDDYQVLIGTNRHTVTATGWLQEENNLKAVLADTREMPSVQSYLGREYGVARYERIRDANFAAADRYYERTRPFWNDVRASWAALFARQERVTLKGPVDKLGLFHPLFDHAAAIERADEESAGEHQRVIREAFDRMVVTTDSD